MATVDSATWAALGLTLTLLGLAASFVMWRRRGLASGLRGAAWSLLPLAAALTGTLRLLWDMADSVARWATGFVWKPSVWLGLILAVTSVALFFVSARLHRRGTPKPEKSAALPGSTPKSVAPPGSDDDFSDIEAILRKRGIS